MKNKVLEELKKRCHNHEIEENVIFTAQDLSSALNISRNTASQYLNEFVSKNEVIKINTRPVYFFETKEVEAKYKKKANRFVFSNFEEFKEAFNSNQHDFEKLIGAKGSLLNVVNHCKAAVSYPGNGLPILIHGPTGTGKSMIASLCYEYAKRHHILEENGRFVSVNCSEYANNPELLTANLFGHVKGAYTGADEESNGLIDLANGGLLFLDEVHCLKAECQEKLFFFMDKGIYHKVGDNDKWYESKCRIVFATTEDPHDALLKTLLRRIPIMVHVPSLKDRPLVEKKELIYTILMKESVRLNRNIEISNMVYQTLMDFEFVGNVGALENAIKAACANAFLSRKSDKIVSIHLNALPDYILAPLKTVQLKVSEDHHDTMIPLDRLAKNALVTDSLLHLYEQIVASYENYVLSGTSFETMVDSMRDLITHYIDYIAYKNRYHSIANDDYLLKIVDKIYSIMINKYSLQISNNEIRMYSKMLSDYTRHVVDAKVWLLAHKRSVEDLIKTLHEKAPRSFTIAKEVVENVSLNLDIELDDLMIVIQTISLMSYEKIPNPSSVGVILCHGYSTASSIADTVNKMLGQYIFDGIDMQIDLSIEKVAMLADEYLKRKQPIEELMLLVDMGSLEEIYKRIRPIANCNIALMNNVSTRIALEAGMQLMQGKNVAEILDHIKENYELSTQYIASEKKKNAIVAICATGLGAAIKISELLLSSLPCKIPVEIIPYEYQLLVENNDQDKLFSKYNVELLIGTIDPQVKNHDFIPVENLMMNDGIDKLERIIDNYLNEEERLQFRSNIMKNFTLSNIVNHLTILNAEKVMEDVEDIVDYLEQKLNCSLDPTRKIGLYMHLSCLIERLMLRNEITMIEGIDEKMQKHLLFAEVVKEAFSVVEMKYSVVLPDAEILFILNYFQNIEK